MNRQRLVLFGVALALILIGGAVGWWGHTAGGDLTVQETQIETEGGTIDAYLYVPPGVSADDPAPGVLATHGYINSKETQAPFAIELARRGHVVLAIDQTGHGYSDPPAFSQGWGGPPALDYLSEHELVDEDRIALEGHSMGGWASVAAAATYPDSYESMVLAGSSTGSSGAPPGNATFPRNLAVVYAEYDEFHRLMWETETAPAAPESEKLQSVFGTDERIETGTVYGDFESGTARALYQPGTTHPGTTHSPTAVGQAVGWIERTTGGETSLDPSDQIWHWKELGTAVALLGGFLFLFPTIGTLSEAGVLSAATRSVPEPVAERDLGWGLSVALTALLPVATYYPLMLLAGQVMPLTAVTPQNETNGIVLWILGNAAIIALLLGVWHVRSDRTFAEARARYGLDAGDGAGTLARSVAIAAGTALALLALLLAFDAVFTLDFRAWVLALKPPSALHVRIGIGYFPAFLAFFFALELLLHGRLRTRAATDSLRRAIAGNVGLLAGPFVGFLAVQYGWLFATGALPLPATALQTIIAFQFVGVLIGVGAVSTYSFHRTGRVWVGAVLNALLVTWLVVASQATHLPL
ncbi:pimeloyl-ACP methyl ester carboxylesterase [Halorubrum trapanicum]|uniref:Pimeloyl-ACP methyl ester carboxylesterase n=1 Tax=Halorubrum trapanicum TaxID=29284 RepID=A0A8J7RU97_9EURY|nr:alpha/beta fold hydrolase [Halorubrum trapanicum]MBP1901792.1 pimeloyl-ACP methyl ester carboxylesterase [Halorubrum trapanicum]